MIITADGHDLDFLVRRRREGHGFVSQSLGSGSVEFAQQTHDAGFLAGTGRSVEHEMWKVALLREVLQLDGLIFVVVEFGEFARPMFIHPQGHGVGWWVSSFLSKLN